MDSSTNFHLLSAPRADYDGAWKEAFEIYLEGLTLLCFPELWASICWEAGFAFRDKELEEVMRDAKLGRQHVDKLVEVRLRGGSSQLILFHIEVASQEYVELERIMYQYHHRLEDRFDLPVLSVAVLGDDRPTWRPHVYERELLGCKLRFEFPVCKLLDFRARREELEAHPHPAAIIILAHLRALETRKDMSQRLALRRELTRLVYERGYGRKDVLEIMRLLDWLLTLPPDLTLAHRQWVIDYEKEKAMPYVTSFEVLSREEGREEGHREGREEGHLEGQQALVLYLLRKRLGNVDEAAQQGINMLSGRRLEALAESVGEFMHLSDLHAWLQLRS